MTKSIEQILRTASPQVRAICLSLLRQLAKARHNVPADEVDPRSRYADTRVEPSGRKIE